MGKSNVSEKIMFESQKKKLGIKRNFYIKLHLKDHLDIHPQLAKVS